MSRDKLKLNVEKTVDDLQKAPRWAYGSGVKGGRGRHGSLAVQRL
jgi:hypothetical protein